MSWEKEVEELKKRKELAYRMGGKEKVDRHHNNGKLTVRERIDALLDDGTFREVGTLSGTATYDDEGNIIDFRPGNFVCGRGKLNGRNIVVAGDDFTVRGGAADAGVAGKQPHAEQMANELGLPIVRLVDGTGGGGSVKTLETAGRTYLPQLKGWEYLVDNLSKVPSVSLGLGSVAGLGAARMVTAHYSLLVKNISQMFIAGPPVVARAGESLTKEELGGAEIHGRNGAVDDVVESEEEAFEMTRRFLSYLPQNVDELPERGPITDDPERREEKLIKIVPRDRRRVYKMRKIIESVVDTDSFFEIGKKWGQSAITGLARVDGWPVMILANDPYYYGGAYTADASNKVTRAVDLAQTFHLPVINLVDNPGFLIGLESEKLATIRHGARTLAGVHQADVPWCVVIVRKCFGVAGAAHNNSSRLNWRLAWPSADWGSLPVEGGLEAAYKSDLEAADDPEAKMAEILERLEAVRSPFRGAHAFEVEDIIDPRDTRKLLCEFANIAAPIRKTGRSEGGYRP